MRTLKLFPKQSSISIEQISLHFGLNQSMIIEMLQKAGYEYSPFDGLTRNHLEIISHSYVHSIKSAYKQIGKTIGKYDEDRQEMYRKFFINFIDQRSSTSIVQMFGSFVPMYNDNVFGHKLDADLIRSHFFQTLHYIEYGHYDFYDGPYSYEPVSKEERNINSQIHKQLRWRLQRNQSFRDFKSNIFTIIITGHYYIFSDEEDLFTTVSTSFNRCFSAVKITLGEALNLINSKLNPQCKITYKILSIE
jgi:hypothetical protein